MNLLPNDVLYLIFIKAAQSNLLKAKLAVIKDLIRLSRVNKRFYGIIAKSDRIWKHLYQEDLSDDIPENVRKKYIREVKKFEKLEDDEKEERAAKKGYEKIIARIPPDNIGLSIMEAAARGGNHKIISELLNKREWKGKVKNKLYKKLLSITIFHGRLELLEKLEEKGIKLESEDAEDVYLTDAIVSGRVEMVKYLEKRFNVEVNGGYLDIAIDSGDIQMLKYITEKKDCKKDDIDEAIANAQNAEQVLYLWPLSSKDVENLNAILTTITSWDDFDNEVKPILELGADVNYGDCQLLDIAIRKNDIPAIKYLTDKGAIHTNL